MSFCRRGGGREGPEGSALRDISTAADADQRQGQSLGKRTDDHGEAVVSSDKEVKGRVRRGPGEGLG